MQSSLEVSLLEYIKKNCVGKENALRVFSLTFAMRQNHGCMLNERRVRAAIAELRKSGEPILSSGTEPAGFFWPATKEEAAKVIGQMSSRLKEISAASRGIEKGVQREFGPQLTLEIQGEKHEGQEY